MAKGRNFSSKSAYDKWVAYGHMHGEMNGKGRIPVKIKGKSHKVNHKPSGGMAKTRMGLRPT